MRIDIATIFPAYLSPLDLSLIGKARADGLLDVRVHDLRAYTHDRHRTVDDSPYGGGAGMVMKPEPWGELLDRLLDGSEQDRPSAGPLLVVPGPGGLPLTQASAYELAREPWLMFACGRYEGIDERVYSYAQERLGESRVRIVSLGDYVLNGGEVAALAVIEAVARLLPGVIGNEESLAEESHTGGLLEYPVYTKPAIWRDREVPQVLLSGDHGRIARWRHEQRLVRTAQRRPDLLPGAAVLCGEQDLPLSVTTPGDAGELFTLTRSCWVTEAQINGNLSIPPLTETLDTIRESLMPESDWRTWTLREPISGRLVGSVRGRLVQGPRDAAGELRTWEIGRLMVAPDLTGRGLGRALLRHCLEQADGRAVRAWLTTGSLSGRNQRMYKKAGFRLCPGTPRIPGTLEMERRLP
ncbi:tRNA (Guanine37-N(1)-) methyltransferase [Austwickia chelonae]|uniref:tRNA (guanine-N(1)-)-methyltransferase n=1 Tax=Austwickia chelonae NBRC 105200 TaxID=1184607 RepID=K6VMI2_9MICO|nr:tRNA (guanosine(37)-N1)-methyltransferase TrmD [Austwickia chelonae]GAB76565.1 tRNA (guanine-N(1)-)-methyltransferase [Austwickia chelonae NBRC 105200]SEW26969.1 tRNA (Guanine37-N(1)-) methyltransferase [Austwickia chelonae]